jgi:transposase
MSIREIVRKSGLSRGTVRKYIRNDVTKPQYKPRKRVSKLDPHVEQLVKLLQIEVSKGRKERRTAKQLFAVLVGVGYKGSYVRVAEFIRHWRQKQNALANGGSRSTFIPLRFAPGEAFQFDWSEDWVVIKGEKTKLQVAHFKLSHSRAFLLRAYPLQTHEMLFDAHTHAFEVFGGVPRRGIYDNMKTAVDKVGKGKAREVNARFRAMVDHYLYEAEFCNPASGWEKGQIEKNVRDSRHRIWQTAPAFPTLEAVNLWLTGRCMELWAEILHPEQKDKTIREMWLAEQMDLMPMDRPFDAFVEHIKTVSPTCLISHERVRYSVPAAFANRPVSMRLYAKKLIIAAEGQIVAEHERMFVRDHSAAGKTIYDWRHYLKVLQRKPGALRNGAPFAELPEAFKTLQSIMLKRPGGDREMAEILALVLHHDEQAVLAAVVLALESGAPSKQHVMNVLARLIGKDLPAPIDAPQALALTVEPQADVERYDQLRRNRHAA